MERLSIKYAVKIPLETPCGSKSESAVFYFVSNNISTCGGSFRSRPASTWIGLFSIEPFLGTLSNPVD